MPTITQDNVVFSNDKFLCLRNKEKLTLYVGDKKDGMALQECAWRRVASSKNMKKLIFTLLRNLLDAQSEQDKRATKAFLIDYLLD